MKLMRFLITSILLLVVGAGAAMAGDMDGSITAPDAARVQDLQQRMLGDEEIMAIVSALQSDPEVQALVSDPKVMEALLAGDLSTLQNEPAFLKLLKNPRVKEITWRLENPDRGTKQ